MVAFSNLQHVPADRSLEQHVEQALLNYDPFRFRKIMARARSGVVVLMGSVSTFYAKSLGFHLTQQLPGVSSVIDAVAVTLPLQSHTSDDDF